jgi:hypothetical protein
MYVRSGVITVNKTARIGTHVYTKLCVLERLPFKLCIGQSYSDSNAPTKEPALQ